eukprot:135002_1
MTVTMASTSAEHSRVNLNTTDASELTRLEHLDAAGAKLILDRTAHRPFCDLNDAATFIASAKKHKRISLPTGTPNFFKSANGGWKIRWRTKETGDVAVVLPRIAPQGTTREKPQSTTPNRAMEQQDTRNRINLNTQSTEELESLD